MNKLTTKTSDKVEVTQAQARAIEEGMKFYLKIAHSAPSEEVKQHNGPEEYARIVFVVHHLFTKSKSGDAGPWKDLFEPLNSLSVYDLNQAILKGYVTASAAKEEL
ncbi:hypothetical protein MOD67_00790 [Bacillus licheniformis]|uniref:hypothetical protein n=1 Tax=Bacillus TaxID=1386 RepID=UPI002280A033|nr:MULTISPECIES: hypothetical protein [Bacillus]MCY8293223.1 hypothetical protein [Bacillus haynesii]MCY8742504.1 hypothetical protein [Bacillus licheniformis]